MQSQLMNVLTTARTERAVASIPLDGGLKMFAYVMPEGFVVGLGYERDGAHKVVAEAVLRRRSARMSRYGAWLPAVFSDGSWYVVRRVLDQGHAPDVPPLSDDDLAAARELLS